MSRKIYNENMVRTTTLLVGPFACAYLMAENYKTLGQEKRAQQTLLIGAIVSVLIFGALIALPEEVADKIPKFLLPVLFAFIAHFMVRKYQAPEIENYLTEGGEKHSNWQVAGISLLVLGLELAAAITLIFVGFLFFE